MDELAEAVAAGDRRALGRAISLVEAGEEAGEALLARLRPAAATVLGFTGAPGAGKSTLISAYVGWLRQAGRRVAVLAVDPSSPFSGGAILGDRIRMLEHLGDPGVFVRSLAARGHPGGVTATLDKVLTLVAAAGWETIIVETVGIGQAETEIAALADLAILVVAPGQGDDVQAMKAGMLEAADLIVVNKSDLAGADSAARQLREMARLTVGTTGATPVLPCSAKDGDGAAQLGALIDELGMQAHAQTEDRVVRRIATELERRLRRRLAGPDQAAALDEAARAVVRGELTIAEAADRIEAQLSPGVRVDPPK